MYSNPLLIRVIKMSNREVVTGKEARQNLVAALNEIADAVSPTMGPGGHLDMTRPVLMAK